LTALETHTAARLKARVLPGHVKLPECDGCGGILCVRVERHARQAADSQSGRIDCRVYGRRRDRAAEASIETERSSDGRSDERATWASQNRFRIGDDPRDIRRTELNTATQDASISERDAPNQRRAERAELLDVEHHPLIACTGEQSASHGKDVP